MKTKILFQAALFALSIAPTPTGWSQGAIYLSNLNQPSLGPADIRGGLWVAQQFTTGAETPGYSLSQVRLLMDRNTPTPAGFSVSIYDAVRGVGFPARPLAQLAGPSPASPGVYTYTVPGLALLPNSVYWVVTAATSPYYAGAYGWDIAAAASYDSASGWGLQPTCAYSADDGGNWATFWDKPVQLELIATVVPEPSVLSLAALVAAVWLVRRRSPATSSPVDVIFQETQEPG